MRITIKLMAVATSLLFAAGANAQYLLSSWLRNTAGKTASYWATSMGMPPVYTFTNTTDSADVLAVAYNTDFVYVRSNGMTDSMGKYMNPGTCISQGYTHKFPRTSTVPATKTISPKVGQIGLLVNGIPIYGLSNAYSWNGSSNVPMGTGVWNVEVGKSEGFVLDATLGAHPQQQGAYHTHDKPYRLYKNTPTSQHSPIIGFAFDGYPVYGPYGYSTATDANSAVTRMKSGYSLRNITTRTTLPGGATASQAGPAINSNYPIGTYCEDYEWLASNGGDLDAYNGRFCITPEYPSGTYAYFVTIDAAGAAAFPYYIGIYYYGAPEITNFPHGPGGNGLTVPAGVTYYTGGTLAIKLTRFGGSNANTYNKLNWTLVNTGSPCEIALQRSADGEHFNEIATFSSSLNTMYDYMDLHPLQKNFYRIKITELSGVVTYSSIVSLNNNVKSSVAVYPTISANVVNIKGLQNSSGTFLSITDALGKKLFTQNIAAGQQQAIVNISSLSKGAYFLSVENNGYRDSYKIFRE